MKDAPRIFSADYYERMRQLESDSWWNAGMRDVALALLKPGLNSRGVMLDVGCGSGQTMAWFTNHFPGWRVAGLDIARDGVSAARASGLAVLTGNATELPIESSSVDLVITLDVLQHLPLDNGDSACLREIRRVLRPGGTLFVRTNSQTFPHATEDAANNFRKYTPLLLSSKLREAGFMIQRLSRINALLGLAEVPRELRASRSEGSGYHGILAVPGRRRGIAYAAKQSVLRAEGSLVRRGFTLPFGRSIVALCSRPTKMSNDSVAHLK